MWGKAMTADFYLRLATAALAITGIWTLFQPAMIFGLFGAWLHRLMPQWFCKPVFSCPPCMSSVWGTAFWFSTGGEWTMWPLFCICLCGTMKLIVITFLRHG